MQIKFIYPRWGSTDMSWPVFLNKIKEAINHTYHIHARVGSAQSAQVIDPSDENYKAELEQFTDWWGLMIKNAQENNRPFITITPEYGPFPYSLYRPNTKIPLGDQWEVNNFIKSHIVLSTLL